MKIRLLRIFNLCKKEFLKKILLLSAIFFVLPLVILILTKCFGLWTFLALAVLNLVWFLTYVLGCPSWIRLDGDSAEFSAYYEVQRGNHRQLHFTATNIRQIEYRQSAVERLFDVGRISFRCDTETEPAGVLQGSSSMFFEIAGIPHFRKFRADRTE